MSQDNANATTDGTGPVDRPVRPLAARLDVLRVLLSEHHPEHHAAVSEAQAEIGRLRTALRIAREGYASEAATGLPVLPQWRERTVAVIDAALGA